MASNAGQMAEFFATFGFKVDKADVQRVEKTLNHIENRIKKVVEGDLNNLRINITGFRFSDGFNTRLYKAMQKKMSILNNKKGLSPEITIAKFNVDRNVLLRDTREAVRFVENNIRMRIRTDRPHIPLPTGSGAAGAAAGGSNRFGAGLGAGAAAGGLGRGFIPGLGVAFGVSRLNQINQQLIGQDLASTAVFGSQEAGAEQMAWVKNLGNKIGFDYRSQADPYLKMSAAGKTAGMSTGDVQGIFTGMAEYGRVMGLTDEDMKGSMRAVEQMLNKGQIYAEELKMQLGERFPAAIQLMAEAVSGGDTQKLFKMMEDGEVSSVEHLPKFAEILSRQARVGGALELAMKTSLAEQERFNNVFNDMVKLFSEAGFEEGQAGIFRTMAAFFERMLPLIEGFGQGWKYIESVIRIPLGLISDMAVGLEALSQYTGMAKGELTALGTLFGLLLLPLTRTFTMILVGLAILEDFTAFLSGRGSLIGDLLGDDADLTRGNLVQAFKSIGAVVKTLYDRVKDLFTLLTGDVDFQFIDYLNQRLEKTIRLLDDLTVLLGGKTRAERDMDDLIRNEPNGAKRQNLVQRRDALYGDSTYTGRVGSQVFGGIDGLINDFKTGAYIPGWGPIGWWKDIATSWGRGADSAANAIGSFSFMDDPVFRDNMLRDRERRNERPVAAFGGRSAYTPPTIQQTLVFNGNPDREEVSAGAKAGGEAALQEQLKQTKAGIGSAN